VLSLALQLFTYEEEIKLLIVGAVHWSFPEIMYCLAISTKFGKGIPVSPTIFLLEFLTHHSKLIVASINVAYSTAE
jgi:hypothetical protein